jgi:hypothetical protein
MSQPKPPQTGHTLSPRTAHNAVAQLVELYAGILEDHQRELQLVQSMMQQQQNQMKIQAETAQGKIAKLEDEVELLQQALDETQKLIPVQQPTEVPQ